MPPQLYYERALIGSALPKRRSLVDVCNLDNPTMMVSSSTKATGISPNRTRGSLSVQTSSYEDGSFDKSKLDQTKDHEESEITIGSHSIGSPKSVFVPVSQSPLHKSRTAKHNLLPPSSKFEGILAQWKSIDGSGKEGDGIKDKPVEYRFRPILSKDEQANKNIPTQNKGADKFPDVKQSTLSSRARKRKDVPFAEIILTDSGSTVSTISYNPRDFDAEMDLDVYKHPSTHDGDAIIDQFGKFVKVEANADPTMNNHIPTEKGISKKLEMSSGEQEEPLIDLSVLNTTRDLMKETDDLLNEIGKLNIRSSNTIQLEKEHEPSEQQSQDKDVEQLLSYDDEDPKVEPFDDDVPENEGCGLEVEDEEDVICETNIEEPITFHEIPLQEKDKDCSKQADDIMNDEIPLPLDVIPMKEKDCLQSGSDRVDIQKPQILNETNVNEEKRDDSSICTSVSAVKKQEKIKERDGLDDEKNREVSNHCDISTEMEEDFNPPVKFIYIPIIHIDTCITNQPKPTSRLRRNPSNRVRSKSANDKKIMDILKKGREKFLKRRASTRQSSAE